jgi:hypothetical protein
MAFDSAHRAKLMGLGAKILRPGTHFYYIIIKLHLKNDKILNSKKSR